MKGRMGVVECASLLVVMLSLFVCREGYAATVNCSDSSSPVVSAEYTGTTADGKAIYGYASGTTGITYGVYGLSSSTFGRGVYGVADAATGFTYGVYGESDSTFGCGVYGFADAETGTTYGVHGKSDGTSGRGVYGYTTAETGFTYGVYGRSDSTSGRGVYGYANAETGTTYGVYGKSDSTSGYGMYCEGDMNITGDLTMTGTDKKIPEYTNKSLTATVTASSEYNSNYSADKINDNIINVWDEGEWASNGGKPDPNNSSTWQWIQLSWGSDQTINEVLIYDRPNKYDKIYDAYLLIDQNNDGTADYTIHLGMFPYGGAPKKIYLTQAQGTGIDSIKLLITEAGPSTLNIGATEIQCYYNPNTW